MSIDLGDVYRLTFRNFTPAGDLASADTVGLTITKPDESQEVITPIVASSTGVYTFDYTAVQEGRHRARWLAQGTNPGAYVDVFDVRPLNPGYLISLPDAKAHLNMSAGNTRDDEELRGMLEAVTSVVERHRNEVIARRTVVETDVMGTSCRLVLQHHPVISLTSIVDQNGAAQDISNWVLDRQNGVLTRYSYAGAGQNYTVTYVAGYTQIPAHYLLAGKIILAHLWQTQRVQSVGQAPTLGGQSRRDEQIVTPSGLGFAIPHRAIELLGQRPSMIV